MNYKQLSPSYKDEVIAEALYQREMEHFHYTFDLKNFEFLLDRVDPGPYKSDLMTRVQQTKIEMAKVEAIYQALEAQLTDPAAIQRAIEKRKPS